MGEATDISWTDATFNPWWGCTKVSPACEHCYAETWAKRYGVGWGPGADRRLMSDKHWAEPLAWDRKAAKAGKRTRVFCASMADVFERATYGNEVLDRERARLWELIARTPNLDWLLLTKRPENVMGMVPEVWASGFPGNVWMGTTAENQHWAHKRIPHLLRIPARIRFVSAEPLLGELDLASIKWNNFWMNPLHGVQHDEDSVPSGCEKIHWVIVGGESGKGARQMELAWVRRLRDRCVAFGVPFHFKQWGQWRDGEVWCDRKQDAGRELDGVIYDEVPA